MTNSTLSHCKEGMHWLDLGIQLFTLTLVCIPLEPFQSIKVNSRFTLSPGPREGPDRDVSPTTLVCMRLASSRNNPPIPHPLPFAFPPFLMRSDLAAAPGKTWGSLREEGAEIPNPNPSHLPFQPQFDPPAPPRFFSSSFFFLRFLSFHRLFHSIH